MSTHWLVGGGLAPLYVITTRMTVSGLLKVLHLYFPQLPKSNNNGTYGILILYPCILFIF